MDKHILLEERRLHNLIFRNMRLCDAENNHPLSYRLRGMIIGYLCEHDGEDVYQKDLESEFFVRGSTMTESLAQLEEDGYIERRQAERDRRLKCVVATEKAKVIHARFAERVKEWEKRLVDGIDPEELAIYFKVVDKLCSNMEAEKQ